MRYLLDTNTCIELINGDPVTMRLFREADRKEDLICMSSIVEFELAFGIANSDSKHRARNSRKLEFFLSFPFEKLSFDSEDASTAGFIRSLLKSKATPIGAYDLLLAAQGVTKSCTVVTDNQREFERVPDLQLANWKS